VKDAYGGKSRRGGRPLLTKKPRNVRMKEESGSGWRKRRAKSRSVDCEGMESGGSDQKWEWRGERQRKNHFSETHEVP